MSQTKIVRIHDRRRKAESIDRARIRLMQRQLDGQNRVIADLIMQVRGLNARVAPATWGFDTRDHAPDCQPL
ncbi:MAG: hypothetical protein KDJ31_19920 [Candidatus Competibacteraceae bacterium]|nr:hypothetical protein [Candidatus Competibacteraceae bacterium]